MTTNLELLDIINKAQGNPSSILQTVISLQEDASNGKVRYVDPGNPIVAQIETSAVIHMASVQQAVQGLRNLYSNLAQTPEQLYNHMSYRDYVNRFASPSTDPFICFVPLSKFNEAAVRVPGAGYRLATIPRDTKVTVNEHSVFTLQFPVNIKAFDTGGVEVSYDNSVESPLQNLTTNIIVSTVVTDPSSREMFLRFTVPLVQVAINKVTGTVQPGAYYTNRIKFTDQYCMARAWYRSNSTMGWKEMLTTHSPMAYDPDEPTMQLKVIEDELITSLPLIYQSTGEVIGEIRVDVYTTKGSEIFDMTRFNVDQFNIDMTPLDPNRDTSVYTAAAVSMQMTCRSLAISSGGKDALTFEQLKERVTNSSLGSQVVPITNVNIKAAVENAGFELVPNVDVLTNRIFLATRSLPAPTNPELVTSANIGISTYVTDDVSLSGHPWVRKHGGRTTFLSRNLYQGSNGLLRLLSVKEVEDIQALPSTGKVSKVNSGNYLYTPFYYVLDTSERELVVRPYHLDQPVASNLDFKDQNASLQLVVNTDDYHLRKYESGYKLRITTNSGFQYKALEDNEVQAQVAVRLLGATRRAYWPGVLVGKTAGNERIWEFDIQTDYDIDSNHNLYLTNGQVTATSAEAVAVELSSGFDIFHTTTSLTGLYRPSEMDQIYGKFLISGASACITHESLELGFGDFLSGLWSRGRSLPEYQVFERYNQDVPAIAEKNVFADPPFQILDGKVIYNYIYKKGDPILDNEGNPTIAHYAGDVVYKDGKPLVSRSVIGSCEFDLLTVDGRHYFVDDETYLQYNAEFVATIVDWVLDDIPVIQAKVLEKTKVYFYPKNQLANTAIVIDDYTEDRIPSEQQIYIDLYADLGILRDTQRQKTIRINTIRYLDKWVSGKKIAVSDAINALTDLYGDTVDAIKMSGLGPNNDIQLANIVRDEERLTLKRVLDVQQDGTYIIREDVTINLKKADPIPLAEA